MAQTLNVTIPAPNIKIMPVTITGTKSLIFHKWSDKAKRMIQEKQAGEKKKIKPIRNPQEEYQDSYYRDSKGKIAFPALCIKQAMVNSARNIEGVTMTLLRGAIFVLGDKDGLIPVDYKEERMREDMVRLGGISNPADVRYRGEVIDWSMTFKIKFNADVISAEQVSNLLQTSGFSSGLGEWRPERNGDFGTYEVKQG
jgi:hypothetical protein